MLEETLKTLRRRRFSGTIYMHGTAKCPSHVVIFKGGKIVKVIELYYLHYDTAITANFRRISFKSLYKQKGEIAIIEAIMEVFNEQHAQYHASRQYREYASV